MYKRLFVFLLVSFSFFGCHSRVIDLDPPQFQILNILDEKTVELTFNKDAVITTAEIENSEQQPTIDGLKLVFAHSLEPGRLYQVVVEAASLSGNSVKFKTDFHGPNPNPAKVIFNEFTTRHSAQHRERIELYVLEAGDLAGLTLYVGQMEKNQTRFATFPSYQVKQGELITLLLRPLGNDSKNEYDIFLPLEPPGLPNTRSILFITESPKLDAKIMDSVAYVDGTSEPSTTFLMQLDWLQKQGVWTGDPIQICGVSPTRSIIRKRDSYTNSKLDWYITVTGGASFSQEKYPQAFKQTCEP